MSFTGEKWITLEHTFAQGENPNTTTAKVSISFNGDTPDDEARQRVIDNLLHLWEEFADQLGGTPPLTNTTPPTKEEVPPPTEEVVTPKEETAPPKEVKKTKKKATKKTKKVSKEQVKPPEDNPFSNLWKDDTFKKLISISEAHDKKVFPGSNEELLIASVYCDKEFSENPDLLANLSPEGFNEAIEECAYTVTGIEKPGSTPEKIGIHSKLNWKPL